MNVNAATIVYKTMLYRDLERAVRLCEVGDMPSRVGKKQKNRMKNSKKTFIVKKSLLTLQPIIAQNSFGKGA